jgi:hypothetical protein
MNGYAHVLDEDAFGAKKGNIVQAFDAFRKFGNNWLLAMFSPKSNEALWLTFIKLQPKQNRNM